MPAYRAVQVRHYHMSLRFVLILGLVLGIVMLTGYVVAVVQRVLVGELRGEIGLFSDLNTHLEEQNQKYVENIEFLEQKIGNLSDLNDRLDDQAQEFKDQNTRLQKSVDQLNSTNALLSVQVSRLDNITNSFEEKINRLKNESIQLQEALSELQDVQGVYVVELEEFDDLRKGIRAVADQQKTNVQRVIDQTTILFNNLSQITIQNDRISLYSIALSNEYRTDVSGQRNPNLNKEEYDRFLDQVSSYMRISEAQLMEKYPFEKMAQNGVVTFDTVHEIVEFVLAQKQPAQPQSERWEASTKEDMSYQKNRIINIAEM